MNSSNSQVDSRLYSGRVLMGCDSPGAGFVTIQEIEGKRHKPMWDEATEVEYLARCKQKAQDMAREIITQAQQKAAAEAQAIRDLARAEVDQAVAEALAETQARLDVEFQAQVQAMGVLLENIQGLGREVWEARRQDFATLTKSFIKKALNVEMDAQRGVILSSLMDEACSRLDAHREFTLKVAPEDYELAKELMTTIQASRHDLGQWKLVTDATLTLGGVMLETPEMLADNALGNRVALLEPYLEQLGLPETLEEAHAEIQAEAQDQAPEKPGVPQP